MKEGKWPENGPENAPPPPPPPPLLPLYAISFVVCLPCKVGGEGRKKLQKVIDKE